MIAATFRRQPLSGISVAQLAAQGLAVDAERRGAALVADQCAAFLEQRDLEFAQRDAVQVVGAAAVEVAGSAEPNARARSAAADAARCGAESVRSAFAAFFPGIAAGAARRRAVSVRTGRAPLRQRGIRM